MAAVVRVKRRINEEPLNAFILNCKRPRVEDGPLDLSSNQASESTTILKFAGTIDSQDQNITAQISKLTQDDAKKLAAKTRVSNRADKNREDQTNKAHEDRFRIVNCFRAQESTEQSKEITVLDVERQTAQPKATQLDEQMASTSSAANAPQEDGYVFDLYFSETQMGETYMGDDIADLSIEPFQTLMYGRESNAQASDDDEDSEDSNEENNWRNDYPDSDDEKLSQGDDQLDMFGKMDLNSDNDLSTTDDDEYQGFSYSVDSEAIGFEDDVDFCDVNRYGEAYARYRRRVLKELNSDSSINEDNEDDGDDEEYCGTD